MHTIIIKVWRGLITEVYSDDPDTEVVVIDEDIESTEAPEIELPEHRVYGPGGAHKSELPPAGGFSRCAEFAARGRVSGFGIGAGSDSRGTACTARGGNVAATRANADKKSTRRFA